MNFDLLLKSGLPLNICLPICSDYSSTTAFLSTNEKSNIPELPLNLCLPLIAISYST